MNADGGTVLLVAGLVAAVVVLGIQTWRLRRREADLARAAEAMARQEGLVTLGRMLAGVAHEMNTPLGAVACAAGTQKRAIAMLAEVVEGFAAPAPETEVLLGRARKALRALQSNDPVLDEALTRTRQLVTELRLAGRGEQPAPEPVDVNTLLDGTLLLLRHELKNSVEVELQKSEVPTISGWPGPLGQVFLNLVMNARQAVGDGGRIRIATAVEGDRVVVRVLDNGPGLPAGCVDEIFRPGFTTKPPADGTGLGLFISRKIVDRHEGELTAATLPEGGAVFTVSLPVAGGS